MTVYVDDMNARLGRMVMCHMVADTDEELHSMADRIGVSRRWFQKSGHPQRHYDIALSKKALALAAGAIAISKRQCAAMTGIRRLTGELGVPEGAVERYLTLIEEARGRSKAGRHIALVPATATPKEAFPEPTT